KGTYLPASQSLQCPTLFWLKNNGGIEVGDFPLRATIGEIYENWAIKNLLPRIPGLSIIPQSAQLPVTFDLPYIHTRGIIDLLVEFDGKPYILDFKAMSDGRFNGFVNKGFKEGLDGKKNEEQA